jgi:hypothetical protein
MIKRNYSRILHYKSGYLIDFPRTTNSLAGYKDSIYQVQVFQRVLQKKPYFVSQDGTPLAEACSWHEFIDWLNTVEIGEKKKTQEEFAKEAVEDETAGKAEQEKAAVRGAEKDLRRDSTERYVDSNTNEKPTSQQSPNGPSWDQKAPNTQPSWSVVDDRRIIEDDDEDEEGYEPPAVCPSSLCRKVRADDLQCPPPPKIPSGWKAIWHDQYNEYYFVDIYTKRPRWQLPTKPTLPRGDSPTPVLRHLNTSTSSETMSMRTVNTRSTN